jgi:hypothetical protein
MKRRFVIPLAVAMALHAILLFGFRIPAVPPSSNVVRPPHAPAPHDPMIEVIMASDTDNRDAAPAPGEPVRTHPDVPEPPAPDPVTQIVMTPTIPNLSPLNPSTTTTLGPVGKPDGVPLVRTTRVLLFLPRSTIRRAPGRKLPRCIPTKPG